MHFCLSPLLFHRVCRHQSWVSAPELDLLDICHVQPTPLMCFLWVDPLGCSRHVLGIFCTSSCSHPASRNHLAEGLRVSQANLPMMVCQKSMDDRLNKKSFRHITVAKQPDSYIYMENMQPVFKYTLVLLQCLLLPCDSPGKPILVGSSDHSFSLVSKLPVLDTIPSTTLLGLHYYSWMWHSWF